MASSLCFILSKLDAGRGRGAKTLSSGQGQPPVGEMARMKGTSGDGVAKKRVLVNRNL